MKQNITYLLYLLLLGIALYFSACAPNESKYEKAADVEAEVMVEEMMSAVEEALEEVELKENANSMELTFVASNLTREELDVFENRALQKVADVGDYIAVISNKEYDRAMREHTMDQALELFTDNKSVVEMSGFGNEFTPVLSIDRFLNGALNNEYGEVNIESFDLRFSGQLERDEKGTYVGTIIYSQVVNRVLEDDISVSKSEDNEASVIVQKVRKDFGDTYEMVWEVLIDEIK